jgi:ParB family transcriptional regulator, chromosome partitioning protein
VSTWSGWTAPVTGRPALGRGLRALIPDTLRARSGLAEIPVELVRPNPAQPRSRFDQEALEELARSVAANGVLQPLLVTEDGQGAYVLIAGERRLRAARLAGLATVPAVIRERVSESGQLELALVENLQRRDLTPLEEARAFENLRNRFGLSQEEIAARVGVDRSTVANALRLLKLSPDLQGMVEMGELTAGHARALLALAGEDERQRWAERAARQGLSVRELERIATEARAGRERQGKPGRVRPGADPNLNDAEEKLGLRLGARVQIRLRRRGGEIVIAVPDQAELMRVFSLLMEGD